MTRKYTALLHSKTLSFKKSVDWSKREIDKAFSVSDSWYVAYSAGKDSTCVLGLVRALMPMTPAVTSVRQWDLPQTEELMARTPNLHKITYDGFNGEDWVMRWRDRAQSESRHPDIVWLETKDQIMARGRVERGVFLGLRADEARYRERHIAAMGTLFNCAKSGKYQCNPIAHWSVWDVWAYIHSNDVDYNTAYDVMESCGIPIKDQRIGPFDRAMGAGALAIIKRCWPDHFNRIAAEHPEARAYA